MRAESGWVMPPPPHRGPYTHSECLARAYLAHSGFADCDVIHEPDGNVPPDFLVNGGRTAVEVRRLNQHHESGEKQKGLEETSIPLEEGIREILDRFKRQEDQKSWYVSYVFQRPIPPWKELEQSIHKALERFMAQEAKEIRRISVCRNFHLNFAISGKSHPGYFILGGHLDHDSGGFILSELVRNARICIESKGKKIAKLREKYSDWWLILDDRITYCSIDPEDQEWVREQLSFSSEWKRIILLDPRNHTRSFTIAPPAGHEAV